MFDMMRRAVSALLTLLATHAYSMTVLPPYPLPYEPRCEEPKQIGNAPFSKLTCWFQSPPYTPALATWEIPVTAILPRPLVGRYPIVFLRHGYAGYPVTCNNDNHARANTIVVKVCAPYFPDQRLYGTKPLLMSWGGPFLGENPEGMQAAEMLETLWQMYPKHIDYGAGVTGEGTSEGATGCILQSMIAPLFLQSQWAVCDTTLPHTLFVRRDATPDDDIDQRGQYWRDSAVRAAWGGFDINLADFERQAASGKLDNIYFRIRGATNDSLGIVDTEFFVLCDRYRIACLGTWDRGGHSAAGEPGVNLPRSLYNEGQAPIRRDGILPVFTQSSANHWGPERGHYSMGLSAFFESQSGVQAARTVTAHVRYRRTTNIGGGIDDQPEQATFNLTLRRTKLDDGQYTFVIGQHTGGVEVVDGTLHIEGITLQSSEQYSELRILK